MSKTQAQDSGRNRKRDRGVRWDKIARVRAEIARGTYDSRDKWEKIIDRLLKAVQSEDPKKP